MRFADPSTRRDARLRPPVSPIVTLCTALALAACSSGGGLTPAGSTQVTSSIQDVGGQAISFDRWEDVYVRRDTLEGNPSELYKQVVQVYADMGIPISTVQPERKLVGAVEERIRRELAGKRISTYLRCGSSMAGEIADRYEVWITLATRVNALEGGAEILTHLRGVAAQGQVSGHRITCSTEGSLEREIFHRLQLKAAGVS